MKPTRTPISTSLKVVTSVTHRRRERTMSHSPRAKESSVPPLNYEIFDKLALHIETYGRFFI